MIAIIDDDESMRLPTESLVRSLGLVASTFASASTTKPTAMDSPISDRLSRLKPSAYMAAKVPTIEIGTAMPGITVAHSRRRKTAITPTASTIVSRRGKRTSATLATMVWVRSETICTSMPVGSAALSCGSACLISVGHLPGLSRSHAAGFCWAAYISCSRMRYCLKFATASVSNYGCCSKPQTG
jgi:hypothetical protein